MNALLTIVALVVLALFFAGMLALRSSIQRSPQLPPEEVLRRRAKRWGKDETDLLAGAAWLARQPAERLEIQSFDGLRLSARWLPAEEPRGRMLLFHGYRSGIAEDFPVAVRLYHDLGYDLLLVDQRAHGESEGTWIGLGVLEKRDCLDWLAETNRRFGAETPVLLAGVSMGATTVMLAAGEILPDNVRGIIADCGFTSPRAIIRDQVRKRLHIPTWPILPITSALSRLLAGYGFSDGSTTQALQRAKVPALFLYGEEDDFVPVEMTMESYEACASDKRLYTVPGASHTAAVAYGGAGIRTAITEFLDFCQDKREER